MYFFVDRIFLNKKILTMLYYRTEWILFTQILAIFLVKLKVAKEFSKFNLLEKIIHCVECSNLAYNVEEWDSPRCCDAVEHIKRMKSNQWEGFVLIFVNLVFKLMMLCPLHILGKIDFIFIKVIIIKRYLSKFFHSYQC